MRKTIAAAVVAASMTVGGLAGAVLGSPSLAGAASTATGAVGWIQEALSGLVDDGTITQEQANAVESALDEARPARGPHGRGFGRVDLNVVAESLGTSEDELRTALEEGQSIADVAAAEGVDVQTVVDAIVAAQEERLQERVDAGELTQEEADERLADAEERATAVVNGEVRAFRGGRHGGRPPAAVTPDGTTDDQADDETDDEADATT